MRREKGRSLKAYSSFRSQSFSSSLLRNVPNMNVELMEDTLDEFDVDESTLGEFCGVGGRKRPGS